MPKKVGRGGKYTTGIKRNSKGGYGGQTYGRRGCLIIMVAGLGMVLSLIGVIVSG